MTSQVPPPVTGETGVGRPATGTTGDVTGRKAYPAPAPTELRRALLTGPAAGATFAAVAVTVVSAVLDDHHLAGAVSALVAAAVVTAASAVTGALGVWSAAARPETVFAAAMASFMTKILVFAVALALIGSVDTARRVPFAVAAISAVLAWLTVEVVLVMRLRTSAAAVFGPPVPGATPAAVQPPGHGGKGSSASAGACGTTSSVPPPDVGSGPPVG